MGPGPAATTEQSPSCRLLAGSEYLDTCLILEVCDYPSLNSEMSCQAQPQGRGT